MSDRKQRILARQAGITPEVAKSAAAEFLTDLASQNHPNHTHVWTKRTMTNGQPWWSCACGEAEDRDPTTPSRPWCSQFKDSWQHGPKIPWWKFWKS